MVPHVANALGTVSESTRSAPSSQCYHGVARAIGGLAGIVTLFYLIATLFLRLLPCAELSLASPESPSAGVRSPLSTQDDDYSRTLSHIPLSAACDARYWTDIIRVTRQLELQEAEQTRPSSSPPSLTLSQLGAHRLHRALLKALCGHPITLGVSGTSISAGIGVDGDVWRVYAYYVWEWLNRLPLLPQASAVHHARKLRHGYRNTAVNAVGTDLTGLCLSDFWANTTGNPQQVHPCSC